MHKLFKLSQQGVIKNEKGEILILRKNIPNEEVWLLPGGRVEENEINLEEALKREIQEETGFKVNKIGNLIEVDIDEYGKTLAHAYSTEILNTENIILSEEHLEYKWISPKESINYLYYKNIAKTISEKL